MLRALSSKGLENFPGQRLLGLSGQPVFIVRKLVFIFSLNLSFQLLSFVSHHAPLKVLAPSAHCLPCRHSKAAASLCPLQAFPFPGWTNPAPSTCPPRTSAPAQLLDLLGYPPWGSLQLINTFLVPLDSKLDAVFCVGSHKCREKEGC